MKDERLSELARLGAQPVPAPPPAAQARQRARFLDGLAELGRKTDTGRWVERASQQPRPTSVRPGPFARSWRDTLRVAALTAAAVGLLWFGSRIASQPSEERTDAATRAAPSAPAESSGSASAQPPQDGALRIGVDGIGEGTDHYDDFAGREWVRTGPQGAAAITLVHGAKAVLGGGGAAWGWSEPEPQWLHLESGVVDVTVPKLKLGQVLTIHTDQAEVIVRGTAFTVQVGGSPPVSTVTVREGLVEVRSYGREVWLPAGSVWRSDDAPMLGLLVEPPAPRVAATEAPPLSVDPYAADRSAPTSSLKDENELFEQATRARARGDEAAYARLLHELVARFPKTPMRGTALAEEAFSLARSGQRERAAEVARRALGESPPASVRDRLWALALASEDQNGTPKSPASSPE